ncbi:MAG: hypothetical protein WD077_15800 [Bacteroidia bacterium]
MENSTLQSSKAVNRITVLWAITECGLGGFFHALKTPFTGLIVGGLAVIYISLIAWHSQQKMRDLGRALLFVLVIKFSVSPHSPPGAYLAVSMQAGFGMLFFGILPSYRVAAVFTALFSMVSSAAQKIIILTLLYGMSIWKAIDQFMIQVTEKMHFVKIPEEVSVSFWLVVLYTGTYALGGIAIGLLAGSLPTILQREQEKLESISNRFVFTIPLKTGGKKKKKNYGITLVFILLTAFVVLFEYIYFSAEAAIFQLLRTLLIIFAWFYLLNPLIKYLLRNFFESKKETYNEQVSNVQDMIPKMSAFARFAWKESKNMNNKFRLLNFVHLFIYFGIYKA